MRKTLIDTIKTNSNNSEEQKQQKLDELKQAIDFVCLNNKTVKDLGKLIDTKKSFIKDTFKELNITEFEGSNGKVTITEIDKSYLDEQATLNYLKEKGLTDYIKVKEYFDNNEIIMAIQNEKLSPEELNQFIIPKKEIRVNIK